jgi:hypothetical protein
VVELGLALKEDRMPYAMERPEPNPRIRKSVTRTNAEAPNGYYPNITQGSYVGGPYEQPINYTNPPASTTMRPSWEENDGKIVRQRYSYIKQTSTLVPNPDPERNPGVLDPLASGPARDSVRTLSRSFYRQAGTSDTRSLDNNVVQFSPYGQQDGVSWTVAVDPKLSNPLFTPATYDADGNQESSVVRIPPSGPHGLHSVYPARARAQNVASFKAQPQQRATGQNRLANSNRAGQTYSATTQHLTGATNVQYTRGSGRRGTR